MEMDKILVSFVIPCYRSEKTLEALKAAGVGKLEVIFDLDEYTWYTAYLLKETDINACLEEIRSIGHWGRMQRDYLREYHPIRFNELILTGQLWTYLADLNEQAQMRMETLIEQMAWVQRMNSIRARAEEIVREEIIYGEAAV